MVWSKREEYRTSGGWRSSLLLSDRNFEMRKKRLVKARERQNQTHVLEMLREPGLRFEIRSIIFRLWYPSFRLA